MKIARKLLFGMLFCALSTSVFAQNVVKHEVQSGETLYSLARNYGVTVEAIKQANPSIEGENIITGQVITIPNGRKRPLCIASARNMASPRMNSTTPTLRLRRQKSRRAIMFASLILHRNWLSNVQLKKNDRLTSELLKRKQEKRLKLTPSRNIQNSTWQSSCLST